MIKIRVNGEWRPCRSGLDLENLLMELGYEPRLIVVEYNGTILPRQLWRQQPVGESDNLEIVTIVGGGI